MKAVENPQVAYCGNCSPEQISKTKYDLILDDNNAAYIATQSYLQIGELDKYEGWVLHISVVISEIERILCVIIPELLRANTPFQLAKDSEIVIGILAGKYGSENIGKVITAFPSSEEQAFILAQKLIKLTSTFNGPDIGGTYHLGSVIYTYFETHSFGDRISNRNETNDSKAHISNHVKQDVNNSTPSIPPWIKSLTTETTNELSQSRNGLLKGLYKPLLILKSDVKGRVIKGIYLKNVFWPKSCIIKEGRRNMWSDMEGREMYHRLEWQYELSKKLYETFPVPKPIDFFQENKNTYFVTEFIKGISLDHKLASFYEGHTWSNMPLKNKLLAIGYLQSILLIVEKLHKKGIVHRDLAPGNFIIQPNNNVYLIDLELSYCINTNKPTPPFTVGSPGFISPEQYSVQKPTYKEDIYALGALLIYFLTGKPPLELNLNSENYSEILFAITNSHLLPKLLKSCLNPNSENRTDLNAIRNAISIYKNSLLNNISNNF